jgi:hypothetical protein
LRVHVFKVTDTAQPGQLRFPPFLAAAPLEGRVSSPGDVHVPAAWGHAAFNPQL